MCVRFPGTAFFFFACLAAALPAHSLTIEGSTSQQGEAELLFYTPAGSSEAKVLLERVAELLKERRSLNEGVVAAERRIAELTAAAEKKKSTRLEWSDVEAATGYSLRLYDSKQGLVEKHTTTENSITLNLEPGEYYFQVAAMTRYKTGTYSHKTRLRVTPAKASDEQMAAQASLDELREKLQLQMRVLQAVRERLRALAVQRQNVSRFPADVPAPREASHYFLNYSEEIQAPVGLIAIPGFVPPENSAGAQPKPSAYLWGGGLFVGLQDTRVDFVRPTLGVEGVLRYDRPFWRYIYPQVKLMTGYSPSRDQAYEAMWHSLLYAGIYYPLDLGKNFRLVGSLATGPNVFFLFSSAASATALQWGLMPAMELHYQVSARTYLYGSAAINFTFDPNGILRFVPFSAGIIQHF